MFSCAQRRQSWLQPGPLEVEAIRNGNNKNNGSGSSLVIGCIIDDGQEAKMEILAKVAHGSKTGIRI